MTAFEFLSVVIAFMAILLTIITAIQNHSHNRKSVRPNLKIRYHLGGSKGKYGISVKNEGLGPALIKHCEIKIGAETMDDVADNGWEKVIEMFNLRDMKPRYETISPAGVIPAGDRIWLLSTTLNEEYILRLKEVIRKIDIKINYESMYSEKYEESFVSKN